MFLYNSFQAYQLKQNKSYQLVRNQKWFYFFQFCLQSCPKGAGKLSYQLKMQLIKWIRSLDPCLFVKHKWENLHLRKFPKNHMQKGEGMQPMHISKHERNDGMFHETKRSEEHTPELQSR